MSFLYVTEFSELAIGPAGRVGQIPQQPPVAEQAIVNTATTSTSSTIFNASTRIVRLHANSLCAIEFGTSPVAIAAGSTGTARMVAGQTEYYGVPLNKAFKVAVVLTT